METHLVRTKEGADLRVVVLTAQGMGTPDKTILGVEGKGCSIEDMLRLAANLATDHDYRVVLFDLPGQGLSSRLLQDTEKLHVPDFAIYQSALLRMLDYINDELKVIRPDMFGISLGAGVILRAMADGVLFNEQGTSRVHRTTLIAPFVAAYELMPAMISGTVRLFSRAATWATCPHWNYKRERRKIPDNRSTGWYAGAEAHLARWRDEPRLAVHRKTNAWLLAALDHMNFFRNLSERQVRNIELHQKCVLEAEQEQMVVNSATDELLAHLRGTVREKLPGRHAEAIAGAPHIIAAAAHFIAKQELPPEMQKKSPLAVKNPQEYEVKPPSGLAVMLHALGLTTLGCFEVKRSFWDRLRPSKRGVSALPQASFGHHAIH